MIIDIKRYTFEDKFARKYYCNSYRFTCKIKKCNRKLFRKKLKIMLAIDLEECYNRKKEIERSGDLL
jgi:hypothetical protein